MLIARIQLLYNPGDSSSAMSGTQILCAPERAVTTAGDNAYLSITQDMPELQPDLDRAVRNFIGVVPGLGSRQTPECHMLAAGSWQKVQRCANAFTKK
jgi:hypothetical protein